MVYSLKSETRQCPACRSREIRHLDIFTHKKVEPRKFVWFISGCKNCGVVFINPPPSQQRLDEFYAPEGGWVKEKVERHVEGGAISNTLASKASGPKRTTAESGGSETDDSDSDASDTAASSRSDIGAPIWRAIRSLPLETGSVLDFGCGRGTLLTTMKERGWTTYGIDPATAPLLRDQGHTMLDEMPETPMFDLIVIKHVLEHVPDPLVILRQARKCIRPGGHLYVATPTLDRLSEHKKKDYCINTSKHIVAFTHRSMKNMLAMAGFSVQEEYETVRKQRLAVLASPSDNSSLVPEPLADAERELTAYTVLTQGRLEALKPVRWRAASANSAELAARAGQKLGEADKAARGFIHNLTQGARSKIGRLLASRPGR